MNAIADTTDPAVELGTQVRRLSNDDLIVALLQTLNHLSRWLTPVHDLSRLETATFRSAPSVKEVLIGLRDNETLAYGLMNAIATESNPDLDRVPRIVPSAEQQEADRASNPLVIMSGFRRVRESSTSLLRALPDNAWERGGFSRTERNWTIRELAEALATNDWAQLSAIDRILVANGARSGIATVSRVRVDQLDKPFANDVGRG